MSNITRVKVNTELLSLSIKCQKTKSYLSWRQATRALIPQPLRTRERPQHSVVNGQVAVEAGPPNAFDPYLKMDSTIFK